MLAHRYPDEVVGFVIANPIPAFSGCSCSTRSAGFVVANPNPAFSAWLRALDAVVSQRELDTLEPPDSWARTRRASTCEATTSTPLSCGQSSQRGSSATGVATTPQSRRRRSAIMPSLYTSDAKILPPNADAVSGADAIEQYWQSFFNLGIAGAQPLTEE
jgi:hypothetical protein